VIGGKDLDICNNCGVELKANIDLCDNCGAEVLQSSIFEEKHQNNSPSKNKYKRQFPVIIVTIALLILICGGLAATLLLYTENVTADVKVPLDYNTIQKAIDNANNGDVIEVKPGTYSENLDFQGKEITLRSIEPLNKDIVFKTIIDGGGNGPVITFQNGEKESVIKGFTITGGRGRNVEITYEGVVLKANVGGGILIKKNSSPTISNNIINSNSAEIGGGVGVFASKVYLKNNQLYDNSAESGGGVGVFLSEEVFLKNNQMYNNNAEMGGGVGIISSIVNLEKNQIKNCSAKKGGGVSVFASKVYLKNNQLYDNSVEGSSVDGDDGGSGGGIVVFDSEAYLKNNRIKNNNGVFGGGAHILNSEATLDKNWIKGNSSEESGGGVIILNSETCLLDNYIRENIAKENGGALKIIGSKIILKNNQIKENIVKNYGGGIFTRDSKISKEKNNFSGNYPDNIHKE